MVAYEITAEMNLKNIISESKEVAQALNVFADKLEEIQSKYKNNDEISYTPDEVGEILITEAQECGREWGGVVRFTPSEVVHILKSETRNQQNE